MTARHNKAIMAAIFFAAVSVKAVAIAHGFTWESVEAIATSVLGVVAVHQATNKPDQDN